MKSTVFVLAAALISSAAFAQNNRQNTTVNTQVGVFPLPSGVNRIVAMEHNNTLLAETSEDDGSKRYAAFKTRYISPRVLAYLFGATTISTEQLVMPPSMNGGFNNNGGGQNFGFPGANNGGNNGFNGGGNGFMFPQSNTNFGNGNGFNNGFGSPQTAFNNGNANLGNVPQNTPFPRNQAGLGLGTPLGNFFAPAQTTN